MQPTTKTAYYSMILGDMTETEVAKAAAGERVTLEAYLLRAHETALMMGMQDTDESEAWLASILADLDRAWTGSGGSVAVEIDGRLYRAVAFRRSSRGRPVYWVWVTADGRWAGDGEWADAIIDCPADLGDDVYDALDTALRTVLA
jgi:hypothetical protein